MSTLYEQIGGELAVKAAVHLFYQKVLSDDRISHFFDDIDMTEQIAKQEQFLTMVFGGPNDYSGKDLRAGHSHLIARGLNDEHFDAVVEHLRETLSQLGVKPQAVNQVIDLAESTRNDVLCRRGK